MHKQPFVHAFCFGNTRNFFHTSVWYILYFSCNHGVTDTITIIRAFELRDLDEMMFMELYFESSTQQAAHVMLQEQLGLLALSRFSKNPMFILVVWVYQIDLFFC